MHRFIKLSPAELKALVLAYQTGDEAAAEKLRQVFLPLIYRLSHRHSMYNTFGEDAENIAWLLFFEFIFSYRGDDFHRLPGLVRRVLIFRLMRQMQQQGSRWDVEQSLEDDDLVKEAAADCEPLQQILNNLSLKQELASLPDRQLQVLEDFYYRQRTQAQIAVNLRCTPRHVRRYQNAALSKLRKSIATS